MKKVTLFLVVVLMLVMALPVSAAREMPIVGDQISIFNSGSQEFPANTPFHIAHGWQIDFSKIQAIGVWDFSLSIDGMPVAHGLRYSQPKINGDLGQVSRIYNFPQGMPEGTYTFNGYWYSPCQYGPDPQNCTEPNTPVLVKETTVTITFTP